MRAALGDLADRVQVEALMNDRASTSPVDTPLWYVVRARNDESCAGGGSRSSTPDPGTPRPGLPITRSKVPHRPSNRATTLMRWWRV